LAWHHLFVRRRAARGKGEAVKSKKSFDVGRSGKTNQDLTRLVVQIL